MDGCGLLLSVVRFLKDSSVYCGFRGNEIYSGTFISNSSFQYFIFNSHSWMGRLRGSLVHLHFAASSLDTLSKQHLTLQTRVRGMQYLGKYLFYGQWRQSILWHQQHLLHSNFVVFTLFLNASWFTLLKTLLHHHHHVQEGLGLIPVPCILKMKLVPPSLPRSSYVSSSFWFIL